MRNFISFLFSLNAGCGFKCLCVDYDMKQTVSFSVYKLEIETLNQQTRLLRGHRWTGRQLSTGGQLQVHIKANRTSEG